ncbi:MAG: LysM peptidoglycan-binding domain-containing protein [Myxococcota bacterium]
MRRTVILIVSLALCAFAGSAGAETQVESANGSQGQADAPSIAKDPVGTEASDVTPETQDGAARAATDAQTDVPGAAATAIGEVVASTDDESGVEARVEAQPVVEVVRGSKKIVLGPQGVDDKGRIGRLHTVSSGDTLWDLSAAYLGTPWVWPSVWIDNHDIANPHLIHPGDRIWITANEMRVVSDDEADAFLNRLLEESAAPDASEGDEMVMDEAPAAPDTDEAMEVVPESVLASVPEPTPAGRQITVSMRAAMGFVTTEQMEAASSILDSPVERTLLTDGDRVYIGLGEGDVHVGDRFTIFDDVEMVYDVGSTRVIGHHVDVLGWLEVKQLTGDTSIAEIRMSYAEITRGTRILARPPAPRHVTVMRTPEASAGQIVFLPASKTVMADGGYVYLNRGELDGLEVGSELEVIDPGRIMTDVPRGVDVQTPDHKVATLVVVSVEPQTAVAFVLNASRVLEVGDRVRPLAASLASR